MGNQKSRERETGVVQGTVEQTKCGCQRVDISDEEEARTRRFLYEMMSGKYYAPDGSGNVMVFFTSDYKTGTPPPTMLYLQRVYNPDGQEIALNTYGTTEFALDFVRQNQLVPITREMHQKIYGSQ